MNRVEITGRLTREPEYSFTRTGYPYAKFTLVVDSEPRYDKKLDAHVSAPNFVSVQAWGGLADHIIENEFGKGDMMYVLGELDQSSYEKSDGSKESKTRVRAIRIDDLTFRAATANLRPVPPDEVPPPPDNDEAPF